MADLNTQIAKARKAGYSDAEITAYLASDAKMAPKVKQAKDAGYSDAEIVKHLGKPSVGKDMAKGAGSGLLRAATGLIEDNPIFDPLGFAGKQARNLGFDKAANVLDTVSAGGVADYYGRGYRPATLPGKITQKVAEYAPNALLGPTGAARGAVAQVGVRSANVLAPAAFSVAGGEGAKAMGFGERGQAIGEMVGGIAGGIGSAVATTRRAPNANGMNALNSRAAQDPAAMRNRLAEYEAQGVQPALVDLVDDSGRGVVRATASRMTPARQATTDFRDARALDLPSRMSGQARRVISPDPRTPDQIRTATAAARSANADQAFGAVRGERLPLDENSVMALRSPDGRSAIRAAANDAMNSLDPDERAIAAELNRLADNALDQPNVEITVGMAQAMSKSLLDAAQAAGRAGRNNSARVLGDLGNAIRGNARRAVPGYDDALRGFEADSRLGEAVDVGEGFLAANTDEFVAAVGGMDDGERALAQAAARRAIERKAGENVSAAPGVARNLSIAPEQQTRNAALLGPERAGQLQGAMRLEESLVRNANDIAPRIGSQTQNKAQDAASIAIGAVDTAANLAQGRWLTTARDWLRSRGINDRDAERLTRMAIDNNPDTVRAAIAAIEQTAGPQAARQFQTYLRSLMVAAPATAALSQPAAAQGQQQQ